MCDFNQISDSYASNNDKHNYEQFIKIKELLDPQITNMKVLDIGNGGYFCYEIDKTESVTAVDNSLKMLENCIHPKVLTVVSDARKLDEIPNKSFDVAILCLCIHHINGITYQSAIDAIYTVLTTASKKIKVGGKLIIIEPTLNNFLHFCQRVLYQPIYFFLRLFKKDMVFFHSDKTLMRAIQHFSSRDIRRVDIILTESMDPLAGTFPGLIILPPKLHYSKYVYYEAIK